MFVGITLNEKMSNRIPFEGEQTLQMVSDCYSQFSVAAFLRRFEEMRPRLTS